MGLSKRNLSVAAGLWLSGGLWMGCGGDVETKPEGAQAPAAAPTGPPVPTGAASNRVVIIGFDGVDPDWVEKWKADLPNISKLVGEGPVGRLGTTTPPQSPVAWSSFATSLNPGGHGIFDFVGRNPKTYFPNVATNDYKGAKFDGSGKLDKKATGSSPRSGTAFWTVAANAGKRARVLFVPYSFPAEALHGGHVLSGLGTPDVRLTNSTFFLLSTKVTAVEAKKDVSGGDLVQLVGAGPWTGKVRGPKGLTKKRVKIDVTVTRTAPAAYTVQLGSTEVKVEREKFSDWATIEFPISNWYSAKALVRFYAFGTGDDVEIYMYPLLVHPEEPYIDISAPTSFAKELKKDYGEFKTIGWEHDTSALNSGKVPDRVFVSDQANIFEQRLEMTLGELKKNNAELFISVFTDTDRASHMFLRLSDPKHPAYDAALAKEFGGFIKKTYLDMDRAIGEIQAVLNPGDRLIIMSDHGFQSVRRGFNTNTWLMDNGYLVLNKPHTGSEKIILSGVVDWTKTKAYALGTGQIYINQAGRERDGIVPAADAKNLSAEIAGKLRKVQDKGKPVLAEVWVGVETYTGARVAERAPDLQLAYHDGYQTSRATGLGGVPNGLFSEWTKKWSGDHAASYAKDTEGFILSNIGALGPDPDIKDIGPTVLGLLNVDVPGDYEGKALSAK